MSRLDIPKQCQNCPNAMHLDDALDRDYQEAHEVGDAVMGGVIEGKAREALDRVPEALLAGRTPGDAAKEISDGVRQEVLARLAYMDDVAEQTQQQVDTLTEGCQGPVSAIALGRAAKVIEVIVCDSPDLAACSGHLHFDEHTIIERN